MPATEKTKPRLKNLDDLFNLNHGVNPLEQSISIVETQPISKRMVKSISIDKLTPFSGHPFRLYEGERLDDMIESIRENGVLVPIIVRQKEMIFEILAGHNRVNAAKLAGCFEIPAMIFENISDSDAMVYVIETNLLQRSFSDMTHTEKAAVIAMHHSKMFSQGKRNDIIKQIKMLENPHEYRENDTVLQVEHRSHSDEKVAEMYSLSRVNVFRYLRIHQLISELKSKLDKNEIAFIPSVTLSFLKEREQELIVECMDNNKLSIDMKKADTLRQFSEKGKLTAETICRILSGELKPKPNRTPTVKIDRLVYAKYFKASQSSKEIQKIVEKALDMYFHGK